MSSSSHNNHSKGLYHPSSAAKTASYSALVSNPTPPAHKPASYHGHPGTSSGSNTLLNSINNQNSSFPTTSVKKRNSIRDPKSGKDGKRLSIFPWSNRKASSAGASHNNYYNTERIPIISDPVLEFSTADFFTSGEAPPKTRPVPVITTYPPSQHAVNTRNSVVGGPSSISSIAGSRRSSASHSTYFGPSTPKTPITPLMEEKSEYSMASKLDEDLGPLDTPNPRNGNTTKPATEKGQHAKVVATSSQAELPSLENPTELRRKLRESEQKTINVLIEYQQKIDKSRKRILELERKLQEEQRINREMVASGTVVIPTPSPEKLSSGDVPSSSPPTLLSALQNDPGIHGPGSDIPAKPAVTLTPAQMQVKITSLESQRDNLREALKGLRTTKDLEIKQYQEHMERTKRMNNLQRSLAFDPFFLKSLHSSDHGDNHGGKSFISVASPTGHFGTNHGKIDPSQHSSSEVGAKGLNLRNPSLDLSMVVGDSSYTSPMSASSTGTMHSTSSSASSSSTWSNSSLATHQQHQHHKPTENSSLPRRIGVGPFLPMAPPIVVSSNAL